MYSTTSVNPSVCFTCTTISSGWRACFGPSCSSSSFPYTSSDLSKENARIMPSVGYSSTATMGSDTIGKGINVCFPRICMTRLSKYAQKGSRRPGETGGTRSAMTKKKHFQEFEWKNWFLGLIIWNYKGSL